MTLIALLNDQPVGTASIFLDDMDTRADLSPWLAAVYVPPEHRSQGIGTCLVQAIEAVSQQVGSLAFTSLPMTGKLSMPAWGGRCWKHGILPSAGSRYDKIVD